MFETETATGNT